MRTQFFNSSELTILLREGSPALFPTDTLPALAAHPSFAKQLWDIKHRPLDKPLILMAACADDLFQTIDPIAREDALEISQKYWPGALTMILPVSDPLVRKLNPLGKTLGMRVPDCSLAKDLLSASGPLATTSANLSGEDPVLTAKALSKYFPDLPLLGPIDWPVPSGLPSTLIKWERARCWKLLRKGAVIPDIGKLQK